MWGHRCRGERHVPRRQRRLCCALMLAQNGINILQAAAVATQAALNNPALRPFMQAQTQAQLQPQAQAQLQPQLQANPYLTPAISQAAGVFAARSSPRAEQSKGGSGLGL